MERLLPSRSALLRLLLLLVLVVVGGVLVAQPGGRNEEEEDPKAMTKPKKRIEVEEEEPVKPKKIVRPEDEQPKPGATPVLDVTDLLAAARQAKSPFVRDFLFPMARPHDVVYTKTGRSRVVEPLDVYLGKPPVFNGLRKFRNYDPDWKLEDRVWEAARTDLSDINYYETLVANEVNRFLEPLKNPRIVPPVPPLEMLRVSEALLAAALRFSESSREQGKRKGEVFEAMAETLRKKLVDVQVQQLELLADGNWNEALDLAKRLAGFAPKPEEQDRIARPLVKAIDAALQSGALNQEQTRDMQQRLRDLEQQFPASASVKPIQDRLRQQAKEVYDRAVALQKKDPKQALELFKQAELIWPRLAGLQDARLTLENAYPVLRVGVRELPVYLSPTHATLESEKLAVDLIFEGLLKTTRGVAGMRYEPALAESAPRLVPLGRQFQIAPNTYWSNDEPVTAADVRHTVRLMKNPRWSGYNPALAKLLEDVQVGGDAQRVTVNLKQGFVDPLSLMTFKVLPAIPWPDDQLGPEDDEKFAKAPIGSGPYQYKGPGQAPSGRPASVFIANPNYSARPGRAGRPSIREIQLVQSIDSQWEKDLVGGVVDLLPDVPSASVAMLQQKVPNLTVRTERTRRIHFLAVNHRRAVLQNEDLRRALAHAIDRNKLLDDFFRKGFGPDVHQPLTAPFPAKSWPCDPALTYNTTLAKNRARTANLREVRLELKYPSDEPGLLPALEALRDSVKTTLDGAILLELKGVPARQLKLDVEGSHTYDLAYYSYDFPSDAFWLWPLFDPDGTGPKGTNYLGYGNDGRVEQLFRDMNSHRDFRKLQESAHTLHGELFTKMPLIPLWQLDRHIVMTKGVQPTAFDPLRMFADVEKWRLEKR